ncbi:salivary glue protein Sgs-3-like [Palaemon carinicauda]|uniref:salivary glue protein Sgs-3-like n=1 Tax=Palaemon carinicauda TaxID=392227 RepID=UPI0035B5EED1
MSKRIEGKTTTTTTTTTTTAAAAAAAAAAATTTTTTAAAATTATTAAATTTTTAAAGLHVYHEGLTSDSEKAFDDRETDKWSAENYIQKPISSEAVSGFLEENRVNIKKKVHKPQANQQKVHRMQCTTKNNPPRKVITRKCISRKSTTDVAPPKSEPGESQPIESPPAKSQPT